LCLDKAHSLGVLFLTICLSPILRSLLSLQSRLIKLSFRSFLENLSLIVTVASHCHGLDVSVGALGLQTITHFLMVVGYFVEAFLLKEV
jgi:hypothetical protein